MLALSLIAYLICRAIIDWSWGAPKKEEEEEEDLI